MESIQDSEVRVLLEQEDAWDRVQWLCVLAQARMRKHALLCMRDLPERSAGVYSCYKQGL